MPACTRNLFGLPPLYTRLLALVATLALSAAAFAGEARPLEGVVTDPAGEPLPGLSLKLYALDAPAFTADHAIAAGSTDEDGAFSIPIEASEGLLLKVYGSEGAGRVRVPENGGGIAVTYPVETEIWLLHDNDHHFTFNHLQEFRDEVRRYRAEHGNVFLLNAGDFFVRHQDRWHQTVEEHYFRRAAGMIALMNALAYDVATPGNHEFDYHGDFTRKALELAEFPLIAANMAVATDKLPRFGDFVVLHTDNRYAIAVLGLSTGGAEGVTRHDAIDTARKYRYLAHEHDLFVALTHIGHRNDRALAEAVPELDIIIGGHSHTLLEEAERVGNVLVAQAGGHPHPLDYEAPKFLGIIRVLLENGRVVEKEGHVITFGGEDEDEESP